MRPILLSVLVLTTISHIAYADDNAKPKKSRWSISYAPHAPDSNPKSKKTRWRIPPNAAVTAVGVDLKWSLHEEPSGRLSLRAGLAEHHSYEQAWAYYTKIFGLETRYTAENKRQERVVDGDKRSVLEHDRDEVFRAGRWARMYGKFGKYKTALSLYDDPTLKNPHHVSVNIMFTPE